MSNKNWLSLVAEFHDEWVTIVKRLGGGAYSEDLVQESYIKLHKYNCENKIICNGRVSKGYMFFVLRSVFLRYKRDNKGIFKIQIESFLFEGEDINAIDDVEKFSSIDNMEQEEAFGKICNMMDNEMENWHWYDRRIFEIYRDTNLSIRGIANETKISFVNIFHTLKRGKQLMRDKFSEDYEDYINGDYNKI